MKRHLPLIFAIAAITACASTPAPVQQNTNADGSLTQNVGAAAGSTYSQTRDGFTDAALSPLEDLNLRRDEIPPVLVNIKSPYDLPTDLTCRDIKQLIGQLDKVLGPDWDTPVPDERLRTEKLADSASEATLGAIASEARGFIPFRSLVRKATGADSHEKRYNQAYKIGAQRRAYLKGVGLAKGCPAPARPDFAASKSSSAIVFKGDAPTVKPSGDYKRYEDQQLMVVIEPEEAPSETISSTPTPSEVESEALQTVPPEY